MSGSDGLLLIDLDETLIDRQGGFQMLAAKFLAGIGRDEP